MTSRSAKGVKSQKDVYQIICTVSSVIEPKYGCIFLLLTFIVKVRMI